MINLLYSWACQKGRNVFFQPARMPSKRENCLEHIDQTDNSLENKIIPFDSSEKESPRISGATMKSNSIKKAAEIIKDPQILINVVSLRVKQLNEGKSPLIKALPSMGIADIALQEIVEGKIKWQHIENK